MGLTKRKDGWYVEFPILDDGKVLTLARGIPGAKWKRWRVGCSNKTMAKDQETIIKNKLLNETMQSEQVKLALITFEQWAKEYVLIEEVKNLRSFRERDQRITNVLIPFFEKILLKDISASDVEVFRQECGKGRSIATVNVDHSYLKHMLKHAMKRDLVTRNVASLVPNPKPKNSRDRVLESDEWNRLYNAAPEWFKPVLMMGYHTGMRLEEILTLTWDRVDLDRKRIFLPGSLTKNGQDRSVPLTPILWKELELLRAQDGVTRIQGLVFQKDGRKLSHTYRVVQELCKEQKIPNFVFHDLRHCAVTNLADVGVKPEIIMEIVGHSSVEMFLRYRKITADNIDSAMSSLNTLITQRENVALQVSDITAF